MVLLQAAIAGGMFVAVLIGLVLLIGLPLLTFILSAYYSGQNNREQERNPALSKAGEPQKPEKKRTYLLSGFLTALVIMIALVLIVLLLIGLAVPGFE